MTLEISDLNGLVKEFSTKIPQNKPSSLRSSYLNLHLKNQSKNAAIRGYLANQVRVATAAKTRRRSGKQRRTNRRPVSTLHKKRVTRTQVQVLRRRSRQARADIAQRQSLPPVTHQLLSPVKDKRGPPKRAQTAARTQSLRKTSRRKCRTLKKHSQCASVKSFSREKSSKATPQQKLSWQLTAKCFNFGTLLGTGAFSQVNLVRIKRNKMTEACFPPELFNKYLAMKVIDKVRTIKMKQVKSLKGEKLVLATTDHPLLVDYFGSFADPSKVYILLEFVIGGEILSHFLNAPLGFFSFNTTRFYISEILCALEHLHKRGFIYRDLKPENILISSTGHIKMVDFGFSKKLARSEKTYTMCGSVEYVAPEILKNEGHDRLCDFWSLGVLTYEFSCGNLPYTPTTDRSPFDMYEVITSTRVRFPRYLNDNLRDYLKKLLRTTPSQRLGAVGIEEIKNHPVFKDVDWEAVDHLQVKPPIIPRYKNQHDTSNFNTTNQTAYFDLNSNNS